MKLFASMSRFLKSIQLCSFIVVALICNNKITNAQTSSQNYISTKVYLVPSSNLELEAIGQVHKTVTYFDGLGRVKQSIEVGASGNSKDFVTPVSYDIAGRQDKKYLPYVANQSNGSYITSDIIAQNSFYNSLYPGQTPFSEIVYEDSPLNRVLEQVNPGMVKGANTEKFKYLTNVAGEVKRWEVNISNNDLEFSNYYGANTLYKNEYKDENNNLNYEFKDIQGRVLLNRAYVDARSFYDTYYVYDNFGMLRYVISPEGSSQLTGNSYNPSHDLIKKYCYYYEYNKKRLLINKQLPGADVITMEYDERDRLKFSIDGNQRLKNQKIEFKYDGLDRLISSILWEPITVLPNEPVGIGITPASAPGHSLRLLEKFKYDNYDSIPSTLNFVPVTGMGSYFVKSTKTLGMLTYDKKAILETPGKFIETAYYYDKYGRLIQTVSTNHLNGIDVVSINMDYAGNVLKIVSSHNSINNTGGLTITELFTYDHVGRLIDTDVRANNLNALKSTRNVYDNLGRLISKNFLQFSSTQFKQKQDYKYNIRGWLTQINNPSSLGTAYFAQRLKYFETGTLYPQYNGNISEEEFRTSALGQINKYVYSYDGINRLKSATFTPSGRYNMSWTYDRNGNITNQRRWGMPQNSGFGGSAYAEVENLSYFYKGNQLLAVNNRINSQLKNGFKDMGPGSNEYFYDANGNLIKDLNQNLEAIQYNSINLPKQVDLMSVDGITKDNFIQYQYRSDGEKLTQKVFTEGEVSTTREYCGRFVYENQELSYIIFSEGVIRVKKIEVGDPLNAEFIATVATRSGNQQYGLTREFHLKDHLGNVRVVFNSSGILSENHYYPFGLPIHNLCTSTAPAGKGNRYLYNSKELQDDLGLNWMDYGARFYDAGIGRWHSMDPMGEQREWISSYNFVQNNPINRIDPNGMMDNPVYGIDGTFLGNTQSGFSGNVLIFNDPSKFSEGMNDKLAKKIGKTYDETQLSDNAKGLIQSHIVNYKLNDGLNSERNINIFYDKNLNSFYQFIKISKNEVTIKLGNGNEGEKFYKKGERYYETTVENIRNLVNLHESLGHGVKHISGSDSEHYKAYELQISNPQFLKTTASFQSFILSETYRHFWYSGKNMLSIPHYKNMFYEKGGYDEYMKWEKWYKN